MVQEDAHLAIRVLLVAEGVLHLGLAAICSAGEVVVAHGNGHTSAHIDLVIVENHI